MVRPVLLVGDGGARSWQKDLASGPVSPFSGDVGVGGADRNAETRGQLSQGVMSAQVCQSEHRPRVRSEHRHPLHEYGTNRAPGELRPIHLFQRHGSPVRCLRSGRHPSEATLKTLTNRQIPGARWHRGIELRMGRHRSSAKLGTPSSDSAGLVPGRIVWRGVASRCRWTGLTFWSSPRCRRS